MIISLQCNIYLQMSLLTHTHTQTQLCGNGVCVLVCVRACNCIDTLFTIDFTRLHSRLFTKKLFNAFKCKQSAHTFTLTHTLPLTLTQSATFTYLRAVTHSYIYSRTQLIHSVALGCRFISFHVSIFPSRLDFFFLPLHICLNDLIFIFPMFADLFVLVMDMRLLKSLPPLGGGGGSHDIREISSERIFIAVRHNKHARHRRLINIARI